MSTAPSPQAAREQLDLYEREAGTLRRELAGLSGEQLADHPVPGTWSIAEIVVHLCDSELAFSERMKRIIAEDGLPPLQSWDENRWMERLSIRRGPVEETAQLLELCRRQMVWVLRELPPATFGRKGMHSHFGELTLAAVLEKANWHYEHHLVFLRNKKALLLGNAK